MSLSEEEQEVVKAEVSGKYQCRLQIGRSVGSVGSPYFAVLKETCLTICPNQCVCVRVCVRKGKRGRERQ